MIKRFEQCDVIRITKHHCCVYVFLASFDNGLVIYNCTAEGRLELERKVHVPSPVVDYNFTNDGNLLVLVAAPSGNLVFVDPSNGKKYTTDTLGYKTKAAVLFF